jgi:hypothetical protein
MKIQDMTQRYRKFKRAWGMWYAFDTVTGNSASLKTRVKSEADQKVNAMNETERQPSISLGLAKVYLNATDPKLATRTWQEVMENIVAKKTDETRRRWEVAIKDRNFDCIRYLRVAETRPEHFDRALADGKVSTNDLSNIRDLLERTKAARTEFRKSFPAKISASEVNRAIALENQKARRRYNEVFQHIFKKVEHLLKPRHN